MIFATVLLSSSVRFCGRSAVVVGRVLKVLPSLAFILAALRVHDRVFLTGFVRSRDIVDTVAAEIPTSNTYMQNGQVIWPPPDICPTPSILKDLVCYFGSANPHSMKS